MISWIYCCYFSGIFSQLYPMTSLHLLHQKMVQVSFRIEHRGTLSKSSLLLVRKQAPLLFWFFIVFFVIVALDYFYSCYDTVLILLLHAVFSGECFSSLLVLLIYNTTLLWHIALYTCELSTSPCLIHCAPTSFRVNLTKTILRYIFYEPNL